MGKADSAVSQSGLGSVKIKSEFNGKSRVEVGARSRRWLEGKGNRADLSSLPGPAGTCMGALIPSKVFTSMSSLQTLQKPQLLTLPSRPEGLTFGLVLEMGDFFFLPWYVLGENRLK